MEEEREHSSMLARTHFNEMEIRWEIWLINKEEGIIGGIYYYEDEEA